MLDMSGFVSMSHFKCMLNMCSMFRLINLCMFRVLNCMNLLMDFLMNLLVVLGNDSFLVS